AYRYFHASGVPIETDLGRHWICALTDINAERVAEERYRLISSMSADFMFMSSLPKDGSPKVEWIAGAFEDIVGFSFDEFDKIGGWTSIMHTDDRWMEGRNMELLLKNQQVENEMRVFSKSGELVWVKLYARPIWDPIDQRPTA